VTIWDFAGQLEFFPAHQFLLSSSNVIYTVVFDASYGYETSVQRLSHWLSFIASSLDQNNKAAFGDAPHQRQGIEVVLVATHTDSPHYKVKKIKKLQNQMKQ
jgi:GTPase SAR1 family protein